MAIELDTASVAPHERLRFWTDGLRNLLNVDTRVEGPLPSQLGMHLTVRKLGDLRLVELEGTHAIRSIVQPRESTDRYIVLCQIYGNGNILQDGVSTSCEPGSVCVYRARARTMAWDTAYRHVSVHIPAERFRDALGGDLPNGSLSIKPGDGPATIFADLAQSLVRNCESLEGRAAAIAEEATLRMLGALLSGHRTTPRANVAPQKETNKARIRGFVRDNLRDAGLDIPAIAHAVGLSPRYVHELFADEPVPLMKWVWTERLRGIHHDLAATAFRNHTISGIAYRWGFSSSAHFSRAFHAQYGVTPSQFRRQAAAHVKA